MSQPGAGLLDELGVARPPRATLHRRILVAEPVGAPVTVAIGDRDRLLRPRQARHTDQLPPGTHISELPGCGYLPMADDPAAVTALIIRSAARSADAAAAARTVC